MKLSSIPLNSKYYAAPDFINRSIVLFIVGRGFRVSTEGLVDEVDDNDVVRVGGCGGGCGGGEGVRGSEGSADDDEIKFDGINGRVGEDNNDESLPTPYVKATCSPSPASVIFSPNNTVSDFKVLKATKAEFSALDGQSVSYATLEFPGGSIYPPHTPSLCRATLHCKPALAISAFGSASAGTVSIPNTL
ncbi:hypothetical protein JHK84_038255 [Glycine max]|nr:hypothetical protein JHK85_038597 [Glycine max]KAG5131858.1 hypothetical protein JHK84_038255 [Glycine max]